MRSSLLAILCLGKLSTAFVGVVCNHRSSTNSRLFCDEMQVGEVKIDDGGSNLTDRFKYKVNALMGVFDPQGGADDERQDGNILNGKPHPASFRRACHLSSSLVRFPLTTLATCQPC